MSPAYQTGVYFEPVERVFVARKRWRLQHGGRDTGYACAVRVIGLDVGSKTIGVAVSDELGLAAHPVQVIARRGTDADVARVAELVAERQASAIVVGLPLDLSGNIGRRARRVRLFIAALGSHLGPDVAIHEWDERFSTAAVERMLIAADVSRQKRKQVVDKQAAAYILQGWLDAQRRAQ